ncbi:NERD domain-containing protein [Micromonospora sp. RTP1Z1]|uniref:NERD domain-containing protein n=1 Tax=Micromonospora sp. RTP1Z1 TaxID=2994043 RepID=UPI0029C687C6|nr:NERD domain-containing protein [Micromonospora sp. RTP1Z1]
MDELWLQVQQNGSFQFSGVRVVFAGGAHACGRVLEGLTRSWQSMRRMSVTIEVFWNEEPQELSERQFLAQLKADLISRGVSTIILVNFFTANGSRQVDFLIITDQHVCHVELKNYTKPIVGQTNGPWSARQPDGSLEVIDRQNPYTQAVTCRFALSDDMHSLIEKDKSVPPLIGRKFYTQFDSVVCVYPRLEEGSEVPGDYKARTLGYPEFLDFLTSPGARPTWNREHWLAFVRMLALTNAVDSVTKQDLSVAAAIELIENYRRRLRGFYGTGLHELVPLPASVGSELTVTVRADSVLAAARHLQLVGPSGSGKSHLAKHTALDKAAEGHVPVFIAAGAYEGRLSWTLDRSVARFSSVTAGELFKAATVAHQQVLLIVDGFNECPQPFQEALLGDLSALCLRIPAWTLLTSQAPIASPEVLQGESMWLGDLAEGDRRAILASYGAPEILSLCDPFTTAYELAIAAECAAELQGAPTTAELLAAFVRKRLRTAGSPAHTRGALRRIALAMDEQLVTSLPLDEVWRVVERYAADVSAPANVIDDVFATTLAATDQGRFAFSHELIGRFLAVEGLALQHPNPTDLAAELRKPRHEDLMPLAVQLEGDTTRLDQLLTGLAQYDLYVGAMQASHGALAARVTREATVRLLDDVTRGLEQTTFTVPSEYKVEVVGGHRVTANDLALLSMVGIAVLRGHFVAEVARLLDATDAACRRSFAAQGAAGKQPSMSTIVSAVLFGLGNARRDVAAAIIIEACRMGRTSLDRRLCWDGAAEISDDGLALLVDGAGPQTPGRLLLLCEVLHAVNGLRTAALAARVLRICWSTPAYHVRLEALDMILSFVMATDGEPEREEIVAVLEGLHTDHIMLSSLLLETLNAYGLLDLPEKHDHIAAEIEEVLENPTDRQYQERAYGIFSSQFEDIVGPPYFAALEALAPERRVALLTVAALGATSDSFWLDTLLKELIRAADPQTLPAFQYWASHLDTETPFKQGVGASYMLAMAGCALFLGEPPQLLSCRTQAEEAWQCYGGIVFWLHKKGLSTEEVAARCEPLWRRLEADLLPAAADPMYWFTTAGSTLISGGPPLLQSIATTFPGKIRDIFEWSLTHRTELVAIFQHAFGDRDIRIVSILESVGDAGTVELLKRYVEDPELGRVAVSAIRRLQSR